MRTIPWLIAVIMAPQLAATAAQNVLAEARRHYDAAAYEEALSTLATAERASRSQLIEVEQYRALCLIALGKLHDAQAAITAIVEADPLYVLPASPKVQSFIAEVRRNALPGVARRLLETGRTAFTNKDLELAREQFALLRRVLADPAMEGRAETADLRVLADGFVTLVSASPAPTSTSTLSAPAPTSSSTESRVTEPVPSPEPPPPVGSAVAGQVVPASVVREVLPPWVPDPQNARQEFSGIIKLQIGVDGRVKSASIQDPSHPAYDARLLQATTTWRYQPATRDGLPVESERMIAVRLRPAQ